MSWTPSFTGKENDFSFFLDDENETLEIIEQIKSDKKKRNTEIEQLENSFQHTQTELNYYQKKCEQTLGELVRVSEENEILKQQVAENEKNSNLVLSLQKQVENFKQELQNNKENFNENITNIEQKISEEFRLKEENYVKLIEEYQQTIEILKSTTNNNDTNNEEDSKYQQLYDSFITSQEMIQQKNQFIGKLQLELSDSLKKLEESSELFQEFVKETEEAAEEYEREILFLREAPAKAQKEFEMYKLLFQSQFLRVFDRIFSNKRLKSPFKALIDKVDNQNEDDETCTIDCDNNNNNSNFENELEDEFFEVIQEKLNEFDEIFQCKEKEEFTKFREMSAKLTKAERQVKKLLKFIDKNNISQSQIKISENSSLKNHIQENDSLKIEISKLFSEKEEILRNFSTKLNKKKEKISSQSTIISDLKCKLDQVIFEVNKLQIEIDEKDRAIACLNHELNQTKELIRSTKELDQSYNSSKELIEKFQNEILQGQLKTNNENRFLIENLQEKLTKLEKDQKLFFTKVNLFSFDEISHYFDQLNNTIRELNNTISQLKIDQENNKNNFIDQKSDQEKENENTNEELEEEIEELRKEIEGKDEELEEIAVKFDQLLQKNKHLENKIRRLTIELKQMVEQNSSK